ncbi:MAG TPA: hypothetical protein VGL35_02895 [Rhizomicrobium sp.]|jgi:hypothetical protein
MKAFLKLTTAAAALLGSVAYMGAPASAAEWGVNVGVGPGVGFDVHTGGYCDRWGCPGRYWAYPIYYGPVYYDGGWFRGPVYTRVVGGEHLYWIHGGWHRDQWRGARPQWARAYHYGPALGLDYYRAHGFRVNDRDWRAWNDRDRYRAYHTGYTEDRYNNNEERYRSDRDRYREHTGYRSDQDRYHDDRDRGTYDQDRYDRDRDRYQHTGYQNGRNGDYDRAHYQHTGYQNGAGHGGYDRDQHRSDENDRDRGAYDRNAYHSDEQGPPMKTGFEQQRGYGHARTPPITSRQNTNSHSHHSTNRKPDQQNQNGPTE